MKVAQPSKWWWFRSAKYVAVFLRELSSVFMVVYVLLYLQILAQLRTGSANLASQLGTTPFLILSVIILAFSLYHSITWFTLLTRVQPVKLGSYVLRGAPALLVNIVVLFLASLFVAYFIFGIGAMVG